MMGIRVVCFVITVVMFLSHLGWLSLIPAVVAIAMPYFAVVVANTRDPRSSLGFKPYEPNLPERYAGTDGRADGQPGPEWTPGPATPAADDPRPGDEGESSSR